MAQRQNINIDQGSTFSLTVDVANTANVSWDLTNYSGRASMKKHFESTSNAAVFDVSINANNSTITLGLHANSTLGLEGGRYVYDVEIYAIDGTVYRILEGMVNLSPSVSS